MTGRNALGTFILAWFGSVLFSFSAAAFGTQRQIDARRGGKPKGDTDGLKIQIVHIENIAVRVTGIGQDVTSVSISGGAVEVIILFNQSLQLALDIGYLAGGKLVLVERHLGRLQVAQKARFFGCEK